MHGLIRSLATGAVLAACLLVPACSGASQGREGDQTGQAGPPTLVRPSAASAASLPPPSTSVPAEVVVPLTSVKRYTGRLQIHSGFPDVGLGDPGKIKVADIDDVSVSLLNDTVGARTLRLQGGLYVRLAWRLPTALAAQSQFAATCPSCDADPQFIVVQVNAEVRSGPTGADVPGGQQFDFTVPYGGRTFVGNQEVWDFGLGSTVPAQFPESSRAEVSALLQKRPDVVSVEQGSGFTFGGFPDSLTPLVCRIEPPQPAREIVAVITGDGRSVTWPEVKTLPGQPCATARAVRAGAQTLSR